MGLKPVELPMWHLAWCFSKASMVHSAQVNQCGFHVKNGTLNGLHPVGYLLGFQSLAAMQGCWQPAPCLAASDGSIKLQVPDPHVQCHGGSYESFGDGELNVSPPCLGWPSQVTGWAPPPTLPPSMGQTLLSTQWHWVEKRGRSNGHRFCGIKSSPWLVAQRSAVASSLWLGFGHMAVDESLWVVPICSTGKPSLHASMENICPKVCLPW